MTEANPSMQEVHWQDIAADIEKLNPDLATSIKLISPSKELSFIKVKYPFGKKIIEDGVLLLPNQQGDFLPIHHPSQDHALASKLDYSCFPVAFLLKNSIELFVEPGGRTVPLKLLTPGDMLGLWEMFDPQIFNATKKTWNITSGARSLFMLPKITDENSHARLRKEFGIHISVPRNINGHWKVFAELAKHKDFPVTWDSELIFFTKNWFTKSDDQYFLPFINQLYREAWKSTLYCRNKELLDSAWEDFSFALGHKNLKPKPHLLDTLKHVMRIALGILPGFRAADGDQSVGPITALQDIYMDVYGLKNYFPTIMQPYHLDVKTTKLPVYYSLQSPTLLESYPKPLSVVSIMGDLRELKNLTNSLRGSLNLENTYIYYFLKDVELDYFHSDGNDIKDIRKSTDMPVEDPGFIYYKRKYIDRVFSDNSPFLRGCIRIGLRN